MNHTAAGIEIATVRSDKLGQPSGGGRFSIHDITFDDIVSATYRRDGAPLLIANNWSSNPLNNVRIDHVTGFADVGHALMFVGDFASLPKIAGLVFTNNILFAGPTPSGPVAGQTIAPFATSLGTHLMHASQRTRFPTTH